MNKFLVIFALVASLFTTSVKADSNVTLVYDNGNFAVEVDRYRDDNYHRDQYNGYYNGLYNNQYIPPQYGPYDRNGRYVPPQYRPYGYYDSYPRFNPNYRYNYYRFDNPRNHRHDRRYRNRWDR